MPRDYLHAHRRSVDNAQPRKLEFPRLDGNPTRLTEQLVPIAHPDNQGVNVAEHSIYTVEAPDLHVGAPALGDIAGDLRHSDHGPLRSAQPRGTYQGTA